MRRSRDPWTDPRPQWLRWALWGLMALSALGLVGGALYTCYQTWEGRPLPPPKGGRRQNSVTVINIDEMERECNG